MNAPDPKVLPHEAEQFLARLGGLSMTDWRDIIARDREPPIRTMRYLLRGLWLFIAPKRLYSHFHSHYSRMAAEHLKHLAIPQVLPMQKLSWRAYHAAGSALQALCCRGYLQDERIRAMYAPFEPHIPLRSLQAPDAASSSTGVAGA